MPPAICLIPKHACRKLKSCMEATKVFQAEDYSASMRCARNGRLSCEHVLEACGVFPSRIGRRLMAIVCGHATTERSERTLMFISRLFQESSGYSMLWLLQLLKTAWDGLLVIRAIHARWTSGAGQRVKDVEIPRGGAPSAAQVQRCPSFARERKLGGASFCIRDHRGWEFN